LKKKKWNNNRRTIEENYWKLNKILIDKEWRGKRKKRNKEKIWKKKIVWNIKRNWERRDQAIIKNGRLKKDIVEKK